MLDRSHAGDPREFDVHQHDVWAQVEHQLDRVLSVRGFADDLDPAGGERLGEAGTEQRLIVDQHDRGRDSPTTARRTTRPGSQIGPPTRPDLAPQIGPGVATDRSPRGDYVQRTDRPFWASCLFQREVRCSLGTRSKRN